MSFDETEEYVKVARAPAALLRIGIYSTILIAPLLLGLATQPRTDHPFVQELAKNLAMVGFAILAMQFVLSARFRWVERPFGLDVIFKFHRCMGIFAATLLVAHPLLYASADEWDLLFGLDHPWAVSLGKVALLALGALVVSTVFRKALSIKFEVWQGIHNGLALSVLSLGFVHSMNAGGDFDSWPMRVLWTVVFGSALGSYVHHKLFQQRLRRNSYEVVRVEQETHDMWSLEMAPSDGGRGMRHLPGQFCFLTLHRPDGSGEEHPFTIASAATASGRVTTTIKASGDHTATVGSTCVGDRATVRGPYGRFSYVLHPEEGDLVLIAAGVGITPLLSMLRHMRDVAANRSVLLLCGNRRERDIVARTELQSIAAGTHPRLQVIHVLSNESGGWIGETGRIDEALMRRHVDRPGQKAFYVCGPPAMINDVIASLRRMGVAARSIHTELFSL